jgi:hypothetical protein
MAHALSRYAELLIFSTRANGKIYGNLPTRRERAKARAEKNPRRSKPKSDAQKDAYSQKCARAGNLSKASATLYKTSPPACNAETVERLRLLHPEGDLDYPKDSRPSTQKETDFWESEIGTNLLSDVFSVRNVGAYFRNASPLGAPDPDGWRGREHISPLFLNDDTDAQERMIKHLIVPYARKFLQSDLHEYAGGQLSAFFKKDLIKIRPINNSSRWRLCAAHLINAHVKLDACAYFTETILNFIQNAGSIDGAIVCQCAKLVSKIHDLAQDNEDPKIICQVDFENAFQSPNRQLCTNDTILGVATREYDEGNVKSGDILPHLPALKSFFPYFRSMGDVASRNRYTDHEGTTHHIPGTRGGIQGDPIEMMRFCLTTHPIWGRVMNRHLTTLSTAYADDAISWAIFSQPCRLSPILSDPSGRMLTLRFV